MLFRSQGVESGHEVAISARVGKASVELAGRKPHRKDSPGAVKAELLSLIEKCVPETVGENDITIVRSRK